MERGILIEVRVGDPMSTGTSTNQVCPTHIEERNLSLDSAGVITPHKKKSLQFTHNDNFRVQENCAGF